MFALFLCQEVKGTKLGTYQIARQLTAREHFGNRWAVLYKIMRATGLLPKS
jgi:hypothetical protein